MAQPDDAAVPPQQDAPQPPPDVLAHFAQQDTPQPPPDVLDHFAKQQGPQPPPDVLEKLQADKPFPGVMESIGMGLGSGLSGVKETFGSAAAPVSDKEKMLQQPWELRDVYEPSHGFAKLVYQGAKSAPALTGGILGGFAGSPAGPAGTLAGGALGAAVGDMIQTIGPAYHQELQKTPNDVDGAYNRAIERASVSGVFSALGWAAFPTKFVQGPIKNAVIQTFGVQAPLAAAEQGVQNVIAGKPVTENMGQAYVSGAAGTVVPAVGHAVLKGKGTPVEPEPVTPEQTALIQGARQKAETAMDMRWQADQPETMSNDAAYLKQQASQLEADAQHNVFQAKQVTAPIVTGNPFKEWMVNNLMPELRSDRALQADPLFARMKSSAGQAKDAIVRQAMKMYYGWNRVAPEDQIGFIKNYEQGGEFKTLTPEQIESYKNDIVSGENFAPMFEQAAKDPRYSPEEQQDFVRKAEALRNDAKVGQAQIESSQLAQKYPWMQQRAQVFKKWLGEAFQDEAKYGSRADYLMNYFPHLFTNPIQARDTFQRIFANDLQPQTMGQGYQKARFYDDIQQALDAGLKLKYTNPEDMIAARLMAGQDMKEKMILLNNLYSEGVAVPMERAPENIMRPGRDNPFPWKDVTAPNGSRWLIAPDVQPLWKNAVEAKGLWANEGQIGNAFRGWMMLKNAWVPIKLGLSLFHPIHVWHINLNNNIVRGLREALGPGQQGIGRRAMAIPQALGQSVYDTAMLMDAVLAKPIRWATGTNFGMPHVGREMGEMWGTRPQEMTQRQQFLRKIMTDAGTSYQLSEQLRIAAMRNFRDALNNGSIKGILGNAPRVMVEKLSKPIFEEWIPNLKSAAVLREAEALMRRDPTISDDPVRWRTAMRTIGKQVDNRYGEMFYGGLFWNRTLKDAAIGSFLSLGWNLGFAREFVGGALEPAARRLMGNPTPTRALIRSVSSKSLNLWAYTFSAMITNAAIQKIMTGEDPKELLDYIFPKIGGLNPDGSPRRISNPFYTREYVMAQKHIEEQQSVLGGLTDMIRNKLLVEPFSEMLSNRTYYGGSIYNENDPAYKRALQLGQYILSDQFYPISMTGSERALQLSGKPSGPTDILKQAGDKDVWMPMLGFGPAPAYASKSETENRIDYMYRKYVSPDAKPYEESKQLEKVAPLYTKFKQALLTHDAAKINEAAQALAREGVSTRGMKAVASKNVSQYRFQRLGQVSSQQIELLKHMNRAEFMDYIRFANKKVLKDPTIRAMLQEYARGQQ